MSYIANANFGPQTVTIATDLTTMQAFDQLGPKARAAVNDARGLWSARSLLVDLVQGKGYSDERVAEAVQRNDKIFLERATWQREHLLGPWSLTSPYRPAKVASDGLVELPPPPPRRGSRAWVEAALKRTRKVNRVQPPKE